jgi:hypothetical protein
MVASASMRVVIVLLASANIVMSARIADAQSIHIATPTEVVRETDPRRFSEPHLAVHPTDPNRFLAAAFSQPLSESVPEMHAGGRCSTFVSSDGARTWTRHDFPMTDCTDPQVAILPDGHAIFVAMANVPGIVPELGSWLVVYHSTDAGVTWDEKPTVVGRGDHPAVAVDVSTSRRKGWIYVTTHHPFTDGNGQQASSVSVARSRDGGRTFDPATEVSATSLHDLGEMPVVLTDGTVVSSFVEDAWSEPYFAVRRGWVMRSTDGGTTFSPPVLVNDSCGPPPGFQLSALASDASNGPFRDRLYFACRQSGGGPVVVTHSTNQMHVWNRPGVIVGPRNIDTEARRVMGLAVNNKGVLGVHVVERRLNARDSCLEQTFAASVDGGETFTDPQRVSVSSCGDSRIDAIATRMFSTYGDYFGIVTLPDGQFRLMWPEMRGGRSMIMTTTVAVDGEARTPAR